MRHSALMLRVLKPTVLSFCSVQQSGERQLLLQKHSGDSPGFFFPPSLFLFWLFLLTETGAIFSFCLHNSSRKNPTWPCPGQYTLKKLVLTAASDCRSPRKLLVEKLYPHLLGLHRLALLPSLCPSDSGFKTKKYASCFQKVMKINPTVLLITECRNIQHPVSARRCRRKDVDNGNFPWHSSKQPASPEPLIPELVSVS